ncbi:MAG: ATP-dependent DNA helicase RecG [Lachnospiraceae bacterium]|nr:ATP-dependent DNA helicase RecG [Lachnospiraceae bacterium]
MKYNDTIQAVKGIGEKTAKLFAKLGVYTIGDLCEYFPRGYDKCALPVPIAQAAEGELLAIEGSVYGLAEIKKIRNLNLLSCTIKDPTGQIRITWFNQPYLKNTLKPGIRYIFRGKVVRKGGSLTMDQPKIYRQEEYRKLLNHLTPIYSLTEGLTNNAISKAAAQALGELEFPEEQIPKRILKEYGLIRRETAIREIHFPKSMDTVYDARKRLVFDEFFRFTLRLSRLKEEKQARITSCRMVYDASLDRMIENLPFQLTGAQKRVWQEIRTDMEGAFGMNRLIQGDVGSGKTILAVLALCLAAKNGYQGCIMVPTEVLAMQHYESIGRLLEQEGLKTVLLTGSMTAAAKKKVYAEIASHEADIIVGTHALIQETVQYDRLGLVVTDEQHRFGVKQRLSLSKKGEEPHVLVMSATPIPRTLAIILYGDLDISLVNELPADRLPIKNCVVDTTYRPKAYRFIENQVALGHQAYIICPMVEESELIEAENVIEYTEKVREALPGTVTVEYLHGKMRPKEKNTIMERFAAGEIQVLVSTTVVEVGVNVPNATVMMIENAERFGLAQLHQLRGRVGRGKAQSYCIMVSGNAGKDTMERLSIMNKSNDGFFIAGEDLKLRGPGDFFGIRQSGDMEFKLADIYNDAQVLKDANEAAKSLTPEERDELLKQDTAGEISETAL